MNGNNKNKTVALAEISILTALIIVMAFTPIGYIKTAGLEITLITIPVVVGAIILGPKAGLFLGTVFGLTSFIQAISGLSAFGAIMFQTSAVGCFVTAVPTRMLMGLIAGFAGSFLRKHIPSVSDFITGFIGALSNTVLFMSSLMAFYWHSDLIQGLVESMGTTSIPAFLFAFVGLNGIVEMICCTIISGAVCKALSKVKKLS